MLRGFREREKAGYTSGSTVTKQTTGALQFMVAFALRGGGGGAQLLREYISLRCALAGGRSIPAETSTSLTYTIISKINQRSVFINHDGLQGETVRTDCQDEVTSIYVQVIQRCPEHRMLVRFLLRPLGARRFRSFDKAGRPQLCSHSCASSIVGSTHPSCGLLIYIVE